MAKKARVDYDPEEDILYVSTGEKVQDSLEFDQFIIDFSPDNRIVGIEIQDATAYLNKTLGIEVDKKRLEEVKTAVFSVINQKEFSFVRFVMRVPLEEGGAEEQIITAVAPLSGAEMEGRGKYTHREFEANFCG